VSKPVPITRGRLNRMLKWFRGKPIHIEFLYNSSTLGAKLREDDIEYNEFEIREVEVSGFTEFSVSLRMNGSEVFHQEFPGHTDAKFYGLGHIAWVNGGPSCVFKITSNGRKTWGLIPLLTKMINPLHGMDLPRAHSKILVGFLLGDLANTFANYLVYGVVYKVFYDKMSLEALNMYWAMPLVMVIGIGAMHTRWRLPAKNFVHFKAVIMSAIAVALLASLKWDVFLASLTVAAILRIVSYEVSAPYYNIRRSSIFNNDLAKEAEYQLRVRYLTSFVSVLGAVSIFTLPVSVTGGLITLALAELLDGGLDIWAHRKLAKEAKAHD